MCRLSGLPGSYKSFLAVALAVCVAAGENFEGHRVPTAGPVVYVAAEGASGLRARILAYCELAGIDPARLDGRLRVLPAALQVGKTVDIGEALEVVHERGAVLLVLDTRARCTVGLEENSATEQGVAIHAVGRLAEVGCAVLTLHHAGRNGTAGRGSNAWDGAVWSDLRITGENLRCMVTCFKHKDVPGACEHDFRLVPHTVSEGLMPRREGESEQDWRTSRETLVVISGDGRPAPVDHQTGRIVREVVRACAGPDGLTRAMIRDFAVERGAGRSQVYEAINQLLTVGALLNVSPTTKQQFVISTAYREES